MTTSGFPAPAFSIEGNLPLGLALIDNLDGTATISGTPDAGTGGSYSFSIVADNGKGQSTSQSFVLTVNQPKEYLSEASVDFLLGNEWQYTAFFGAYPAVDTITLTGSLPGGLTFTDNGDGTATIAGTPTATNPASVSLTLTASNGVGTPLAQSFTINLINSAPIFSNWLSTVFNSGSAGSFDVGAIAAPSTIAYGASTESGDTGLPSGVTLSSSGVLSGTATTAGVYTFTITATNSTGSTSRQFTLIVNDAPTDIALSESSIDENTDVDLENTIGVFSATDPDTGDVFSFTLVPGTGDDDNSSFIVDSSGHLVFEEAFDYETQSSYSICVAVTDQGGLTFEETFVISVNNINEQPTEIALSAASIAENSGADSTVGTFTTTDPDTGDEFIYTLASGEGATDNGSFSIDGESLKLTPSANYETKNSYSIRVRSTDGGELWTEHVFTISITDVNEAPTLLSLGNSNIDENSGTNATVGTLSTTDPDAGESFTYEFAAGDGDTDNGLFNINGNTLRATGSLDHEAASSRSVRIRTTDHNGLHTEQAFTITVNNLNDAPTNIALSPAAVNENLAIGTVVGVLSTTDQDSGNTFTYSLVSGDGDTDNTSFTIDGSGNLKTTAAFDYETKNSYSIRLRSRDQDNLFTEKILTVTVTDVADETPSIVSIDDSWAGFAYGTGIADADPTVAGDQAGVFGIDAFATVGGGLAVVAAGGDVRVNAGVYAEAVTLSTAVTVHLLGNATFSSLAGVSGSTVDRQSSTLTVGAASNTTFSGVLAGSGELVKVGSGALTLAGSSANTASGTTTIEDGTLILGKSDNVAAIAGPVVIGDGVGAAKSAVLKIAATEQISDIAALSLAGADAQLFSQSGTETLTAPATPFHGGDVRVAGTLITVGDYAQEDGTTTFDNGTLKVGSSGGLNGIAAGASNATLTSGVLQGSGTIWANIVTNYGTIDPGNSNASVGRINIRGNLRMMSSSVVYLDVGSPSSDQLNVGINQALALPAGSYTNLSNYDLDPYLRGDVAAVTEPGRRGVNDGTNVNGTVRFDGTLNVRALSGYTPSDNTSNGASMNFVWRALDLSSATLNPLTATFANKPSDFAVKNDPTVGGDVGAHYESRFKGTSGQFNAIGQSVASVSGGVPTLRMPNSTLGQAKTLTMTSFSGYATPPASIQVISQVWNAWVESHIRVSVTVKNNTASTYSGPIFVEILTIGTVVNPMTGAFVFNAAGTVMSPSGAPRSYLVVTGGNLASNATAVVQVDLFVPSNPGKGAAMTFQVVGGGLPLPPNPEIVWTEPSTSVSEAVSSFTVTVALTSPSTQTVTVDYDTVDGTATAGEDYIAASGTLTFAAGETSKTITIYLYGDSDDEGDETFTVLLSNVTGALLDPLSEILVTILDND